MSTQEQEAPKVKMTLKERRMAREIKNYQQSSNNFLPRATFRRLVASTTRETIGEGFRFNGNSIKALQVAAAVEHGRRKRQELCCSRGELPARECGGGEDADAADQQ